MQNRCRGYSLIPIMALMLITISLVINLIDTVFITGKIIDNYKTHTENVKDYKRDVLTSFPGLEPSIVTDEFKIYFIFSAKYGFCGIKANNLDLGRIDFNCAVG